MPTCFSTPNARNEAQAIWEIRHDAHTNIVPLHAAIIVVPLTFDRRNTVTRFDNQSMGLSAQLNMWIVDVVTHNRFHDICGRIPTLPIGAYLITDAETQ